MELHEFVSKTIFNIEQGINGTNYVLGNRRDLGQNDSGDGIIDFDVLVSVNDEDKTEGGGKVQVLGMFNGGLGKTINKEIKHSSRIQFQIRHIRTKPSGIVVNRPSHSLRNRF